MILSPKEKAKELVDRYYKIQNSEDLGNEQLNKDMEALYKERGEEIEPYWRQLAKDSALIAVDEIIETLSPIVITLTSDIHYSSIDINQQAIYWQEVKQEIENI